jgi:hypothetical protein
LSLVPEIKESDRACVSEGAKNNKFKKNKFE